MSASGILTVVVASPTGGGINIVGSTWTPARDSFGNVLASDLLALPLMTQLYVGGPAAVMNTVIETPHYWRTQYGADSSPGIVNAWSGAAWDHINNIMYVMGGGHGDSSMLENGIYGFNLAKMTWARVKDRSPTSAWQQWTVGGGWNYTNTYPAAAQGNPAAGTTFNNPLADNAPTATHNYNQLVWVTPNVMGPGNVKGGVYQGCSTRGVMNLDTGSWSILHFQNLTTSGADWASYVCAFLDGNSIHHARGGGPVDRYRYELFGSEVTDWTFGGFNSFGRLVNEGSQGSVGGLSQKNCTFCDLRERREHVYFCGNQTAYRVRHGQCIDANSTNWDAYTDLITLASADGSHLDFNATSLFNNDVFYPPVPGAGDLNFCGAAYSHDEGAIYVCPNYSGSRMYRITGIAGTAWTVEKLPVGTSVLSTQQHQTYGRFRVGVVGGVKLAVRVSSTTGQTEVCRLA